MVTISLACVVMPNCAGIAYRLGPSPGSATSTCAPTTRKRSARLRGMNQRVSPNTFRQHRDRSSSTAPQLFATSASPSLFLKSNTDLSTADVTQCGRRFISTLPQTYPPDPCTVCRARKQPQPNPTQTQRNHQKGCDPAVVQRIRGSSCGHRASLARWRDQGGRLSLIHI